MRIVPVVAASLLCGGIAMAEESAPKRILVAYHSESGNTEAMAGAVRDGATGVEGVEVWLRAVAEVTDEEIAKADGILVGTPVHWAGLSAATKTFLDRVGGSVMSAEEDERVRTAGAFCTGGAPASGKELARLSILAAFFNMRFVAVGGVAGDGFGTLGAQATTGPDDPGLSDTEKAEARRFGERFARITLALSESGSAQL